MRPLQIRKTLQLGVTQKAISLLFTVPMWHVACGSQLWDVPTGGWCCAPSRSSSLCADCGQAERRRDTLVWRELEGAASLEGRMAGSARVMQEVIAGTAAPAMWARGGGEALPP